VAYICNAFYQPVSASNGGGLAKYILAGKLATMKRNIIMA